MSEQGQTLSAKDQWRIREAATKDNFVANSAIYNQLHDLIHQEDTSVAECVQPFVDRTIEIVASPDFKEQLDEFVNPFAWSIVELGAHTPYTNTKIHSKLVDFVHELQKAVVIDPNSTTGEPLSYLEEQASVFWTDLPMFRMCCSEEMICFEADDPSNTEREMTRWRNLSALWAGLSRSKSTDFTLHGFGACVDIFGLYHEPIETTPSLFMQQIASIWFIFAADTLFLACQEETGNRNRKSWDYWTRGVKGLKDVDGDSYTQDLVDQAVAMIQKAEQSGDSK